MLNQVAVWWVQFVKTALCTSQTNCKGTTGTSHCHLKCFRPVEHSIKFEFTGRTNEVHPYIASYTHKTTWWKPIEKLCCTVNPCPFAFIVLQMFLLFEWPISSMLLATAVLGMRTYHNQGSQKYKLCHNVYYVTYLLLTYSMFWWCS